MLLGDKLYLIKEVAVIRMRNNSSAKKEVAGEDTLKNTILALLMEAPGLGEIQLRKALVMADILNASFYGKGLTGATYIKYTHGPIPDRDSWLKIQSMLYDGTLYRVEEPVGTQTKHAYYTKTDPDYHAFTGEQVAFIQDAARFAKKNSASMLSKMTHDDVYNNTPFGEVIPLSSMFGIRVKPGPKLDEWQKEKIRSSLEVDDDFAFKIG